MLKTTPQTTTPDHVLAASAKAWYKGKVVDTDGYATDKNGEINATNKSDLLARVHAIGVERRLSARVMKFKEAHELAQSMVQASATRNKADAEINATVMSEVIYEQMNREGFVEELYGFKEVGEGVDVRIPIRRKDITAYELGNDNQTIESIVEQAYHYPKSFYLTARVVIEDMEIAQRGAVLLDEKIADALEATMTRRDRIARLQWLASAGVHNAAIGYSSFGPETVSAMITQVSSNLTPQHATVIANDLWDDLRTSSGFLAAWDEVTKYTLVQDGRIGGIYGTKLITDGYRPAALRVLEPGESFVTATPASLGSRSVTRAVSVEEINEHMIGSPRSGVFLCGIESLITNGNAVACGFRIA